MHSVGAQLDESEILLRRVPPDSPQLRTTVERGDGGLRATTPVMSTRKGKDEEHLSCSRLCLTSPRRLLEDLRNDGIDPAGWQICQFKVADVMELDLEIEFTPTDRDPGHCSITGVEGLAYPNSKAQKLARRTRVLTVDEIDKSRSQ